MANQKKHINVYVDAKVYDALKREAKAEDRTFSNYISRIIDARIVAAKKDRP